MHQPKSILENETQRIFWDFDIQMDRQVLALRLDLGLIYKKKRTSVFFHSNGP